MKVTYQGVAGAYSHIAAKEVFPEAEYVACETFEQATKLVEDGSADYAVIPVENSNAGRISDVHFLLLKTSLSIRYEHFLRVEHQLLGLQNSDINCISSAISHPQALAQCSDFLEQHNISTEAKIDTAKSCKEIINSNDKHKAAIASKLAAEIYGLKILASNIENSNNNTTRFLVMGTNNQIPDDDDSLFITSCIFRTKSIPAALYKALGGFATNGINIVKLESYLINDKFLSARFYIEFESHPQRQTFKNAFNELSFFADDIQILGTYKSCKNRYER